MQIIPVIDLKEGEVVHAQMGNRQHYQPVNSILCHSSDIFNIVDAFLSLHPFEVFYIADLDALTGSGNHDNLLNAVLKRYYKIQFWIDTGLQIPLGKFPCDNYTRIIGSESCEEKDLKRLRTPTKNFVLSLDYSKDEALGPKLLFEDPNFWPASVIIMTLGRVGSNYGPDLTKLQNYCNNYPQKYFIAAGGIRNCADLIALAKIGINQALVATALHNGTICSQDIKNLQAKKYPGCRGIL